MKKWLVQIVFVLLVSLNNLKLTSAIAQSEARFSEIEAEIALLTSEMRALQSDIVDYEPGINLPSGQVIAEIKKVALTNKRYDYEETTFKHVIVVEYVLHNHTSEEYRPDHDLDVYVNNVKAEHYYNLDEIKQEYVSAGRAINLMIYYGTNEEPENVEIEFKELFLDDVPTIMRVGSLK